jgi:hypothetical protein
MHPELGRCLLAEAGHEPVSLDDYLALVFGAAFGVILPRGGKPGEDKERLVKLTKGDLQPPEGLGPVVRRRAALNDVVRKAHSGAMTASGSVIRGA